MSPTTPTAESRTARAASPTVGAAPAAGSPPVAVMLKLEALGVVVASLAAYAGLGVSWWAFAALIAFASPLPARVSSWSVLAALALGGTVGVIFGVSAQEEPGSRS